jgi:hypothetical protein
MSAGFSMPTVPLRARVASSVVRTRLLAAQLHQRGVPLEAVENALTLAAARRLARSADAPPLGIIRSLAYFSPVIEEVLTLPVSPEYFRYLRQRIATFTSAQ